jgi:phosphoribosylamine---glycine ligase
MAKVLIIGSGGREHAFAWKISQSSHVNEIFVCPGNAGTSQLAKTTNIEISTTNIENLINFAKLHNIDLCIVGPELPLALGIVDKFKEHNISCFGPCAKGAQIESSKSWCKKLLQDNNIPTAQYQEFTNFDKAKSYLHQCLFPQVIKADGLAAGKGVVIAEDLKQAITAIDTMLNQHAFGASSNKIIIEQFLEGVEASYMVMVNGTSFVPLVSSQDHKARDNDNQGPNTGGMGAFSPSPYIDDKMQDYIETKIITPTLYAMKKLGIDYQGFLYAGLMIHNNKVMVLEYNARMGDPETQVILHRLNSDLFVVINQVMKNEFSNISLDWSSQPSVNIVMASNNYPFEYPKGEVITGLDKFNDDNSIIFHSGTKYNENHEIITNGGRVLNITNTAETLQKASDKAYEIANKIHWPSSFYRTDIGQTVYKSTI